MFKTHIIAALVATAGLAAPASASVILQNGGFELGAPSSGYTINAAIPGWKQAKPFGIEVQTTGTLSTISAHSGNAYVELDTTKNSGMFQNVGLHIGRYVLSFWYSPRTPNVKTNGINYNIAGIAGKVDNLTAGATVGAWTQYTFAFFAPKAKTYKLTFAASGTSDGIGGLLDDVAIAAVPVPAAGFGLIAALGALGAVRRRKSV
jgi:hypothetical protein